MIKLSAIAQITLLLIAFFSAVALAQGPPPPDGVAPPPNNGTGGGGAIFDPLTPPWAVCNDPASIEVKFPPGIIDANLADVFRLEPQVRFICGGETKILYNWTISPPPPRPLFPAPLGGGMGPGMEPPMGHERALVIPPGVLEGDKIYEVALVAFGRVNNSDMNPVITTNVSAMIRGRRVRPSITIRGGKRRGVRVGSPARVGVETQGLQDLFDRYRVHCCKLVDDMDPRSDCGLPCQNVTFPDVFDPSASFASRFNRTVKAFNFTVPGLYRIHANISWNENGTDRDLNATQIVEATPNGPFDSVSVVAPRNDLFEGQPAFFSVAVARRNSTDRERTTRVVFEFSGNKGPSVNISRPPVNDDFRLRVNPDEIATLNDPVNGRAFLEVRVKVNDAHAPGQPPIMTADDKVWLRPQPTANCMIERSQFDIDFGNTTVTAFRSGRSRLNISIAGVDRELFQDITFNLLIDLQSPDGRNHTVSVSPGAEANDRAYQDFAVGYLRGNPQGKATAFIELGAYGKAFRKIKCGEFSLFSWNSANPQEILRAFDRMHRRARTAVEEKDFRALHEAVNDMVGILSVTPAQFVTQFPNFATQMGLFLNALTGMILNRDPRTQKFLVDNIAGPGREAIIRFVFETVRLFKTRWTGNSYMTTSLPGMLIKLATADREQNIPDLRAVGRDVMEIFNTVGSAMPRNLRFRFLQQIIRVFGSKEGSEGPGASDSSPINLGSSFRADVLTFAGANAAANKTYNCSGGDVHIRPSPKQFENIGDDDSVSIAVGRTSAALFGLSGVLASDVFDINSLIDSVPQSVSGLPSNNSFEFRLPCPPGQDCKKIRCSSYDDSTDTWVEIPTRLAPPIRNGTDVPQAPAPAPGAAPPSGPPPAGTFLPDIICSTTHLSVFSLTVGSGSGTGGTSAAGNQQAIIALFSSALMFVLGLLMF